MVFLNDVTAFAKIIVQIDDLVRVGDAFNINVPALLAADRVFDKSVGLVGD